jgi:hypothetical protein
MNARLPSLHITLSASEPLSIEDGQATRVRVLEGLVWITEEGSPDDHFVSAGETFELKQRGKAVLLSDQGARLELISQSPVSVHTGSLWSFLQGRSESRFSRRSVRPLALYAN